MIADGPAANRPPHRLFAFVVVSSPAGVLWLIGVVVILICLPVMKFNIVVLEKQFWLALCLILGLFVQSSTAFADQKLSASEAVPGAEGITKHVVPMAAPVYEFADEAGNPVKLSDFKGRFILLNIWATWCGPCIKELPYLIALQEHFADKNFEIITVSVDTAPGVVINFLNKNKFQSLPSYIDTRSRATSVLNIEGLPTTFVINPMGQIVYRGVGGIPWSEPPYVDLIGDLLNSSTKI